MKQELSYVLVLVTVIVLVGVGVVFSPENTPQIIGFGGLIATSVFSILQNQKAAEKVAVAAVKVQQVADVAEIQAGKVDAMAIDLSETKEVAKSSHVMLNSNFGLLLNEKAVLARWKADHDPDPQYAIAAEQAEKAVAEHAKQQERADVIAPPSGFGAMPGDTPGTLTVPPASVKPEKVEVTITGDVAQITTVEDKNKNKDKK